MPGPVFWVLDAGGRRQSAGVGESDRGGGLDTGGVVEQACDRRGVGARGELDLPVDGHGAHRPVGHGGLRAGQKRSQTGEQGDRHADPAGGGQQSGGLAAQQPGQPEPDHRGTSLPSARAALRSRPSCIAHSVGSRPAIAGSWVATISAAPRSSAPCTRTSMTRAAVSLIELAGGLIGQDQPRRGGQNACDRDPLGLPAGQFVGQRVRQLGDPQPVQRALRAGGRLGLGAVGEQQWQTDVFGDVQVWEPGCVPERPYRSGARPSVPCRSIPGQLTVPVVGVSSPANRCSSVDLPDPDGPVNAIRALGATVALTPRTATIEAAPEPNRRTTRSACATAGTSCSVTVGVVAICGMFMSAPDRRRG